MEIRKIGNLEIRKSLVLRVRWLVLHVLATPANTLELFSGCIDGRMDGRIDRIVYNFEKGITMKVNIKGRRTPGNPEATYEKAT